MEKSEIIQTDLCVLKWLHVPGIKVASCFMDYMLCVDCMLTLLLVPLMMCISCFQTHCLKLRQMSVGFTRVEALRVSRRQRRRMPAINMRCCVGWVSRSAVSVHVLQSVRWQTWKVQYVTWQTWKERSRSSYQSCLRRLSWTWVSQLGHLQYRCRKLMSVC